MRYIQPHQFGGRSQFHARSLSSARHLPSGSHRCSGSVHRDIHRTARGQIASHAFGLSQAHGSFPATPSPAVRLRLLQARRAIRLCVSYFIRWICGVASFHLWGSYPDDRRHGKAQPIQAVNDRTQQAKHSRRSLCHSCCWMKAITSDSR